MKRKLLSMLLATSMVLSFTACGDKEVLEETTQPAAIEETAATEPAHETTATDATEEVTEEAAEEEVEVEFSTGSSNGNVYTNEFLGIGCTFDSDWSLYTDEQIAEHNQATIDSFGNYAQAIEEGVVFTDMIASNANQTDTITITYEKLEDNNSDNDLTNESFYSALASSTKEAFESVGITDVSTDLGTTELAGDELPCLRIQGLYQGHELYENVIIVVKSGYRVTLTAASFLGTDPDEYFAYFYSIN